MLMSFYCDVAREDAEIKVQPTGINPNQYFITVSKDLNNDMRLVLNREQLETLVERAQQELTNTDVEKQQLDHYKEVTE